MGVVKGWEGRFFEDFEIGDVYRSRLGRTVTETDNIWFTNLTLNTNQVHFNNPFGEASPFGMSALMAAGLTLFIVTLIVNFGASAIVARSRSGASS